MRCRSCSTPCGVVALIFGLLAGVGAGVLFFYEQIPGFAAAVPTVLVLGAVALGLLLVGLAVACCTGCPVTACLAEHGTRLLVGALGTVAAALLFPVFALFAVQLVLAALVAFFAVYLAVQLICFVLCVVDRLCDCGR